MTNTDLSRRIVLGVLGGGAASVLAGCGDDADSTGTAGGSPSATESSSSPSPTESESAPEGDGGEDGGSTGTALVAAAEVPVGSGVILKEQKVVVTQPTKGEFLAFDATCTHQGCPVQTITGDQILCPCHGSVFSATDGSVVDGPAEKPLAAVKVSVEGGQVVQA